MRINEETYKKWKASGEKAARVFENGLKFHFLMSKLEALELVISTNTVVIEKLQRKNEILQQRLLGYTDKEDKEEEQNGDSQ